MKLNDFSIQLVKYCNRTFAVSKNKFPLFVLFGPMNTNTKQRTFLQFLTRIYVFLSDRSLLLNPFMKNLIFVRFLANIKARVWISITY